MLKIEKLKVGDLPPLTFTVQAGECLAVLGPSGSGKTRLLRAIADLDPADGYVSFGGSERGEMSGPAWRKIVRYCPAEPEWWESTVARHVPPGPQQMRFERIARQLDLPADAFHRDVDRLSTGERQRFALARALADEPKVLLLDEPTGALDGPRAALVEEVIKFQVLAGRTILLVSHDEGQVERLADARLELAPPAKGRPETAP